MKNGARRITFGTIVFYLVVTCVILFIGFVSGMSAYFFLNPVAPAPEQSVQAPKYEPSAPEETAEAPERESEPERAPEPEDAPQEMLAQEMPVPEAEEEGIAQAQAALQASAERVYYSVYYFDTAQELTTANSAPTPSASVIKVFIMQYIYESVSRNERALSDTLGDKSVLEQVQRMIQYSDNAATNLLIDECGMETLNEFFAARGYTDTRLERRMLDFEAREQGLENYTSLNDVMKFLKTLYENRTAPYWEDMLTILAGQTVRTKLPSQLPERVQVANKTGELEDVENDIGLVFSAEGNFAIAVLCDGVSDTAAARQAIGALALEAYLALE